MLARTKALPMCGSAVSFWVGVQGPHKNLKTAYFVDYCQDLENPPLLVVSDFVNFEVHTNFTCYSPLVVYIFMFCTSHSAARRLPGAEKLIKPGALEVRGRDPRAAEEVNPALEKAQNLRARHQSSNDTVAAFSACCLPFLPIL